MSLDEKKAFHKNNIEREVAGLQPLTWDSYVQQQGGSVAVTAPANSSTQVAPAPQQMTQMPYQAPHDQPTKKFNSKVCGCIDFWE
jgi:hypothetical protein